VNIFEMNILLDAIPRTLLKYSEQATGSIETSFIINYRPAVNHIKKGNHLLEMNLAFYNCREH